MGQMLVDCAIEIEDTTLQLSGQWQHSTSPIGEHAEEIFRDIIKYGLLQTTG